MLVGLLAISLVANWEPTDRVAAGTTVYAGQIKAGHNGYCLEAPSSQDGSQVTVWPCTGGNAQHWLVIEMARDVYKLQNGGSGKCLNVGLNTGSDSIANGLAIRMYGCTTPQSNYMRQGFILTRQRQPSLKRYQIRPAMNLPEFIGGQPVAQPVTRCVEVYASGGGGAFIDQWRCDVSSLEQSNQYWTFDSDPEFTWGAGDGQQTQPTTVPARFGRLVDASGFPFCSAQTINGASGAPDWLITARHCVSGRSAGTFNFQARYDSRSSPVCLGTFWVDQIALGPLSTDTAFLKVGGNYSCLNGSWIGQRVHDLAGSFLIQFSSSPGLLFYSYGYPSNLGGGSVKMPVACAEWSTSTGASPGTFRLYCESGSGSSGAGWIEWGTDRLYATSNGVTVEDVPYGGGFVRVPMIQQHFWHTNSTWTEWVAKT